MVRSFFTFLSGFFFVLVAVPTVYLLSLMGAYFGHSLYEGEFVDEVYEVGVEGMVDEVMDLDPNFSKILFQKDVEAVVRDSFEVDMVRDVFLEGVEKMGIPENELTVSFASIHDRAYGLVDDLTDLYVESLPDCEESDLDFGTNLPSCVDGKVDKDEVLKKIDSRVENWATKSIPPSYTLRADSFLFSKLISSGVRQMIVVTLVVVCLFLLFVMMFTRYPYIQQMLLAVAWALGIVGMIVYLTALVGGGLLVKLFMSLINDQGDYLLELIEIVVRYGFEAVRFYGLLLLIVGIVFGAGAIFVKKKGLKFGRK